MTTKLTLTMEKDIIAKAKRYAKGQGRSLSNLVEDYLKALIEPHPENGEEPFTYSPLVKELWGAVQVEEKSIDYDRILEEELLKKYLS